MESTILRTRSRVLGVLIIQAGPRRGERLAIPPGPSVVGRAACADVAVAWGGVGPRHLLLEASTREVVVRDLGSPTGTLLNGEPLIGPAVLRSGDHLRLGGLPLTWEGA